MPSIKYKWLFKQKRLGTTALKHAHNTRKVKTDARKLDNDARKYLQD